MTKFHHMDAPARPAQFLEPDRTPWSQLWLVVAFDVLLFASTHVDETLRQVGLLALSHLRIG